MYCIIQATLAVLYLIQVTHTHILERWPTGSVHCVECLCYCAGRWCDRRRRRPPVNQHRRQAETASTGDGGLTAVPGVHGAQP